MSDIRFSQLATLTQPAVADDYIPIVDFSDKEMSGAGSNKRILFGNLASSIVDVYGKSGTGSIVLSNNPTLSGTTLAGTTTINSTTYTYGTGAAAAFKYGLAIEAGDITDLGSNVATFLISPSAGSFQNMMLDYTGTGNVVMDYGPAITNINIDTAATFNATSYTYGTGAATAHRTALGLTTLATTTPAANVATFLATPSSANLAAAVTGVAGTGALVFGTSPSLTTPSIAGLTLSGLVTHSGGYSQTGGANFNVAVTTAANLTASGSGTVTVGGAGGSTINGGTLTLSPSGFAYGAGAAATHRTALGLTTLATTTPAANVATFLTTPSSANLRAAVTDETGTGSLVFATSPTITSPTINSPTFNSATTFNATSYTYSAEAASAMRTALDVLPLTSVITVTGTTPAFTDDLIEQASLTNGKRCWAGGNGSVEYDGTDWVVHTFDGVDNYDAYFTSTTDKPWNINPASWNVTNGIDEPTLTIDLQTLQPISGASGTIAIVGDQEGRVAPSDMTGLGTNVATALAIAANGSAGFALAPVGPYVNDAAAAAGGVAIGQLYYIPEGQVRRRMA